jgi:hypothetical protein
VKKPRPGTINILMVVTSYALNPASLSVNFELSALSNICINMLLVLKSQSPKLILIKMLAYY